MSHEGWLTAEEMARLIDAALETDIADPGLRQLLLGGPERGILLHLPVYSRRVDQVSADLSALNHLDDGGVALTHWLRNAARLRRFHPQADYFRHVAQLVEARARGPEATLTPGFLDDDAAPPSNGQPASRWRRSPAASIDDLRIATGDLRPDPDPDPHADPEADPRRLLPPPRHPPADPASDRPPLDRAAIEARLARGDHHFVAITLDRLDLKGLDFTGARFTRVSARGADFSEAILDGTTADDIDCLGARFVRARFRPTGAGADARPADWSGASFKDADLQQAIMPRVDLRDADLNGVSLLGADLTDATLDRATLRGARVEAADLTRASLRGIRPDHRTTFADARVDGCVIDKASLEALGDDYGGLQRCHRMVMRIIDPVADLRASFSGFWAWFHAIALLAFVAPYLLFVARITLLERARDHADTETARAALTELRAWAAHQLDADRLIAALDALQRHLTPDGEAISVARALGRFIYTGGALDGHVSWLALITFTLLLAYNAARGYLLWRTKSLEHQEDISGLPARFTPDRMTRALLAFARFGAWGNLVLVFGHTIAFLVNTQVWL